MGRLRSCCELGSRAAAGPLPGGCFDDEPCVGRYVSTTGGTYLGERHNEDDDRSRVAGNHPGAGFSRSRGTWTLDGKEMPPAPQILAQHVNSPHSSPMSQEILKSPTNNSDSVGNSIVMAKPTSVARLEELWKTELTPKPSSFRGSASPRRAPSLVHTGVLCAMGDTARMNEVLEYLGKPTTQQRHVYFAESRCCDYDSKASARQRTPRNPRLVASTLPDHAAGLSTAATMLCSDQVQRVAVVLQSNKR